MGNARLTVEIQNPLTVSLEDIALSRSWSFTLPPTAANCAAFDFAGVAPRAVRVEGVTADSYAAEYYVDGVPVLPNALLYLDSVKAGGYVCQLIDNSQAALARMKDENTSIRDIVGDVLVSVPTNAPMDSAFGNNRAENVIIYDAGVETVAGVFYPYTRISFNSYWPDHKESRIIIAPPPTVPVYWLMQKVAERYGLTLGEGGVVYDTPFGASNPTDDVWRWGVIPVVTTEVSQDEGRTRCFAKRLNQPNTGGFFAARGEELWENMGAASELAVAIDITIPYTEDGEGKTIDIYKNGEAVAHVEPLYVGTKGTAQGFHYSEVVELGRGGALGEQIELAYDGRRGQYINLQTWADTSSVVFFRYVPNGRAGQRINLSRCLPDVGAWDLLKFLCTYSGGVPYVKGGTLSLWKYNDIGQACVDLSSRYTRATTHDITRAVSGIARRNYYLMSTEKLEEDDPQYKQRRVCVEAEDPTLEARKETYKAPFASEYIQQEGEPSVFTGRTIRAYTAVGGDTQIEAQESSPFVGLVCKLPDYEAERFGEGSRVAHAWWLKCAAIQQDAPWVQRVENYVTKAAGVYAVKLKMSAVDVVKFDPLTEVYIEPLNLRGVVSSIRYTAGEELAEVVIIKSIY